MSFIEITIDLVILHHFYGMKVSAKNILNSLVLSKWRAQGRLRNIFPQPIKLQEKSERGAFCENGKRA